METLVRDHLVFICFAAATAVAIAAYATLVVTGWMSYGRHHAGLLGDDQADSLLDRFLPQFEVREQHHIQIAAPAAIAYEAARAVNLSDSGIIRAIFRLREWVVGAPRTEEKQSGHEGLVNNAIAMGWGKLAEIPGRVIVMGAVTQPWAKKVVFRAISTEQFASFAQPGYVKIVWSLRVDPKGSGNSLHVTETRACATDSTARGAFRRYWACFSPGIVLIRLIAIRLVKARAERAARLQLTGANIGHLGAGAAHRH
ncbi:MAG: hypothetical protein ABI972_04065 [Acidobacteriota bacterium]